MRLHFTVNIPYLITHTLARAQRCAFSSEEQRADIIGFLKYAQRTSARCVAFLAGRRSPELFFTTGTPQELADFFTTVAQSKEFATIRMQTEDYSQWVRAQWERNYPVSSHAITQMTGFDFNKDLTVMVTHPSLKNGRCIDTKTITWGHHEDWPNYTTVYLWHEALHTYFDFDDLSHALIQLITDNELRSRLNHATSYPPFTGHKNLFPLTEKILPSWRAYLLQVTNEGKGDILAFYQQMQQLFYPSVTGKDVE